MIEDGLTLSVESELVSQLFGTQERFIQLYQSQTNCIQFGSLPIPRQHCLDTYNLIRDFTKIETAPLLGLLHHVLQHDEKAASYAKKIGEKALNFWHVLEAYNKFDQVIISRYANRVESETKKRVHKIDESANPDKMIITFIKEEFEHAQEQIHEFYILLFFDIYSAFLHYNSRMAPSDEEKHQVIKRMSHFVLRLLPRIIGTYRFGDYNSDLKDLAFYNLDKENYLATKASIERQLPNRAWLSEVSDGLQEIADKFPVKVSILKRQKGVYSAYQKSLTYKTSVEDLWDLFALRVIIDADDADYCYQFLAQIQENFKQWSGPKAYADYIAEPKDNGYQSLHVVIESQTRSLVEVQIRTSRMNLIAELGTASHQVYKTGSDETEGPEPTPSARIGRHALEQMLNEHGLTINDFIDHLGISLEHIPIEHYYEGIVSGLYNPKTIVKKMLQDRR